MALTDWFRVNMPYGMMQNNEGDWCAFNREYLPLGGFFKNEIGGRDYPNSTVGHNNTYTEMPVHTPYKGFRDDFVRRLATWDGELHAKLENGKVKMFWFYDDATQPMNSDANWNAYMDKIKRVSKVQVDTSKTKFNL